MNKTLVIVESPLSGNRHRNKRYARLCLRDCLLRGEAPYASHLLYDDPLVLDDTVQEQRELGMKAGFAWGSIASKRVVYMDLGESAGMTMGIAEAEADGQPVERRYLPPEQLALLDAKEESDEELRTLVWDVMNSLDSVECSALDLNSIRYLIRDRIVVLIKAEIRMERVRIESELYLARDTSEDLLDIDDAIFIVREDL